ncbi:MAG: flippase-like domain-containing protein [Bacteroidales bacterium]|nr:flippase-like domain-containing protein [Bacteroidales bacterium]
MEKFKKILPDILKVILFLGLGILFIWLSIKDLDKEDIQMIFSSMSLVNNPRGWFFIMLSVAAIVAADLIRAARAELLLKSIHYKPRFSMMFYSVMVCYLANLALPRLGEVLRCTFLQRYENVPFQKSLGTVILERAVDLVCWIFLLIIAMLLNNGLLSQLVVDQETGVTLQEWFAQKGLSYIGNYLIYIIIAIVILLVILIRATRNWWQKKPALVKIANFFKGIWHGFISIKDIPKPWHFVFWTVAMWVCYFFGVYLFFHALPYLQHIGPGAAFSVLVFGTIAFIISQGGLGAYPLITAGIVMLYGISYPQGLAAGWIGWILQTAVSLVLGFFSLAVTSFYKKHDSAQIPKENE